MKKSVRLLLLGLLTPLLLGSVFAFDLTSDELEYIENNKLSDGTFTDVSYYTLYNYSSYNGNNGKNVCVIFSGFSSNRSPVYFSLITPANENQTNAYASIMNYSSPYFMVCTYLDNYYLRIVRDQNISLYDEYFSVNKYWVVDSSVIFNGYLGFDVQGLLDNYNNCQSDLNNCDTITNQCLEDKSILSGQLLTCNSDKESLTNYNEALSTQLNECLNNQGSGVNLSGLVLNNNSLFRYLDDSLLSLPINNNLFLPLGYQGALDSGNVLYIKAIDEEEPENYYITPEDKVSIIDILSYIFVFFLGIGIIFSLIKLFKKLFTN